MKDMIERIAKDFISDDKSSEKSPEMKEDITKILDEFYFLEGDLKRFMINFGKELGKQKLEVVGGLRDQANKGIEIFTKHI